MPEAEITDGRRARRSASRDKIVTAFLALVREGALDPGARAVAEKAGVSPRTVFRCFEDLEALYRELTSIVHAEFLPRAKLDLNTSDRAERLDRLLKNRAAMFSDMEPFRLATERLRHRFASLEEDSAFLVTMERKRLAIVLNPDDAMEADFFEALNAVTSFDFWRRLRIEQGLSKPRAARVMTAAARAIYAAAPDPGPVHDEGGVR
ncbi:TetR/AcrR family transcriptional regulator [Maricaulaceae bacterium MS644]